MSKSCGGLHCPGCGDGGGHVAVLVIAGALIIAAIARPVAHVAEAVGRFATEALEITGIVLASAAGLALLGGSAYGALRLYRWRASRTTPVSFAIPALSAPQLPQIEAAPEYHVHLHGLTDDQLATIVTRHHAIVPASASDTERR